MKLCEDSKMTVKDRPERSLSTKADAHGGSLAARLKFHSFLFMAFNQLHREKEFRKQAKHAKSLVNEIRNISRQRIKPSKSAPEHEEADSAYHQRISDLLEEHAIDQFLLCFAVLIQLLWR
jgi:deoxyribodipyrimidine photolyase